MDIGYVIPDGPAQSLDTLATALAAEANILHAAPTTDISVGASTLFHSVKVLGASSTDITNAITAVGGCKVAPGTAIATPVVGNANAEMLLVARKYSGSGAWTDLTGSGNDATLVNSPTFDSDRFALTKDGNEHFTVADAAALDIVGQDYTLAIVFKPTEALAGAGRPTPRLISKWGGAAETWSLSLQVSTATFKTVEDDGTEAFAADGAFRDFEEAVIFATGAAAGNKELYVYGDMETSVATGANSGTNAGTDLLNLGAYNGDTDISHEVFAYALWSAVLTADERKQALGELLSL